MAEIPDLSHALQVTSRGSWRQRDCPLVQSEESCPAQQSRSQLPCAGSLELEDDHTQRVALKRNRTLPRAEESRFKEQTDRLLAFSPLSPPRLRHRGIIAAAHLQLPSSIPGP